MTFGNSTPQHSSARIIPLPRQRHLPTCPETTPHSQLVFLSASWQGVPVSLIPEQELHFARQELPKAISVLQKQLEPGSAEEILSALTLMANRRGLSLPDPLALELDVEIMTEWPSDLFRKAFKAIWTSFNYRRFPEVADFYAKISDELQERQKTLSRLKMLEKKLSLSGGITHLNR